ncbi:hypothetical protein FGIG_01297 [Fasciola gigantica]|uniref:Uncharacterized protein n=1 Tax=Fasciola gigantica TaxID=46835 RepID=A0A504Y5Y1_FASGI|nr:hypothetical protein FGIG_01297 [Fasciola gigantica]
MFSNQYMGTRLASRSLPRSMSSAAYQSNGPYSRLNTSEVQIKPINARPEEQDNEEVDYSFMNLPVRERRKLFLSAERPPTFRPAGADSLTMPRPRAASRPPPQSRYETQSEYGGVVEDPFGWEPAVTQTWTVGTRNTPSYAPSRTTSSSGTIILHSSRGANRPISNQPLEVPVRQYSQYTAPQRSPVQTPTPGRFYHTYSHPSRAVYRPQFSTTIRIHDPYAEAPRGSSGGPARVYPVRRFSTMATPTHYTAPNYSYNIGDQSRPVTPGVMGSVSQPLRVNVYNSDASTVNYSPTRRGEPTYISGSPVYPAYPAHMERPLNEQRHAPVERFTRGQSVQPVTIYARPPSPIAQRTTTMQSWKPLQAPSWIDADRPRRQGRFITSHPRQSAGQTRTQEPPEPVGITDF